MTDELARRRRLRLVSQAGHPSNKGDVLSILEDLVSMEDAIEECKAEAAAMTLPSPALEHALLALHVSLRQALAIAKEEANAT